MSNDVWVSGNGNEINSGGKYLAGFLMVLFLLLPIYFMIGLWPDQMPANGVQWYSGKLFRLRLNANGTLNINTIIFLLVALAGFLGSMIHVASSFVSYVGCGKLKQSWLLWYCVKPFTGAGIGVIFYFVVKAGILNFSGAESANPYGLVMLAVLAGLFTDKATLKLEEIFTALFHPKDERTDKIDEGVVTIAGFDPQTIVIGEENTIVVKGSGFDKTNLTVKINDEDVPVAETKSDTLTFKYTIPEALVKETELQLLIVDANGKEFKGVLKVIAKADTPGSQETADNILAGILEDGDAVDAEDFVKG
jgi:IPT/TIG domain-containing protein